MSISNDGEVAQRLREIAERAEKATPGEWTFEGKIDREGNAAIWAKAAGGKISGVVANFHMRWAHVDQKLEQGANLAFSAHARADIPWLLTLAAARESEIERLNKTIESFKEDVSDVYEVLMTCRNDLMSETVRGAIAGSIAALEKHFAKSRSDQ